jgi:hypothetical protein
MENQMEVGTKTSKNAITEIFEDINKNLNRLKGFNLQYDKDSIVTCWLDIDNYTLAETYIKIYTKKANQTVYIPFGNIIKIEIF